MQLMLESNYHIVFDLILPNTRETTRETMRSWHSPTTNNKTNTQNVFTLTVTINTLVEIRQKPEFGSPCHQRVQEILPSKFGVRVVPIKVFDSQANDVLWDTERSFKVACYRGT